MRSSQANAPFTVRLFKQSVSDARVATTGLVSGLLLETAATLALYPLDTVKTRLQRLPRDMDGDGDGVVSWEEAAATSLICLLKPASRRRSPSSSMSVCSRSGHWSGSMLRAAFHITSPRACRSFSSPSFGVRLPFATAESMRLETDDSAESIR